MRRKTEKDLKNMLDEAAKLVTVGGRYRHAKSGGEYALVDLAFLEASEEVAVIYRREYGADKFLWARSLAVFLEEVEIDGVRRPRFEEIKS
ncbi:MAG: DUF1653 domain-containing protein [Candidatus Nomurabacteria bacterium]|jgi:hypothetical protein|nr:DUF1653 domain-containing protein [Candidatus Nomurabacteria bacterium]